MTDLLVPPARPGTAGTAAPTSSSAATAATRVVLDTSVLVSDPESLFAFADAEAIIPLVVIEELDGHKTRLDDVGRAARQVLRQIEELRVANGGDIRRAAALPGGGTLRIETNGLCTEEVAAHGLDPTKADNRILAAALGQHRSGPTVVVSNDAALRIKAAQVGLEAREHLRRRGRIDDRRPSGWTTLDVPASLIDTALRLPRPPHPGPGPHRAGTSRRSRHQHLRRAARRQPVGPGAPSRLTTVWWCCARPRPGACGHAPRSSSSPWTCWWTPTSVWWPWTGSPGTGKTILALAAGLEQVMEGRLFDKLAVYRPVVPVGKAELGFLPGTLDDKLDPWMTAVTDALVALTDRRSHADARALLDEMTRLDKLSLEAVTYLRGRTLQGTYVVVDEAQNLEPTTLKTILTRVGEGTKVVFTGDTSQIDAPVPVRVHQRPCGVDRRLRGRTLLRPRTAHDLRAFRGGIPGRGEVVGAGSAGCQAGGLPGRRVARPAGCQAGGLPGRRVARPAGRRWKPVWTSSGSCPPESLVARELETGVPVARADPRGPVRGRS